MYLSLWLKLLAQTDSHVVSPSPLAPSPTPGHGAPQRALLQGGLRKQLRQMRVAGNPKP